MAFIKPTSWTRTQGFPKITGNMAGATLTDSFYCVYDLTDILMKVPEIRTKYDESNISPQIAELLLSSYDIQPTDDKKHAYVTLNYQPSEATTQQNEYEPEYFLENASMEKGLSTHTDYLMNWNYDLYQYASTNSGTTVTPTWWETATTNENAHGYTEENEYCWAQEKPPKGSDEATTTASLDWILVKHRTKKVGIESYIIPAPVVQERIYYRSRRSAEKAAATTGSLLKPKKDFGVDGGEWLVMSATMQKDNRRYLVERSFQWAESWDSDLYS